MIILFICVRKLTVVFEPIARCHWYQAISVFRQWSKVLVVASLWKKAILRSSASWHLLGNISKVS